MIGSFTRKTAWNRLMKKLKAKAAQSSGFTLIEVIFAIIVLSIVSITLLEMFTVSTKTNAAAGVLDKARSLCVEASEEFRANPDGPNPLDPSDVGSNEYLQGFNSTAEVSGEIIYTKYYDRYWSETDDEIHAAYVLEIVALATGSESMPVSYYPESAVRALGAITISSGTTVKLEKEGMSGCKLFIEPNSYVIMPEKIIYSDASVETAKTAMIPIHLDCSGINVDTEISVINEIGSLTKDDEEYEAIADIYICDSDEAEVTVKVLKGVATSNNISTKELKITRYIADISVKEKNSGRIIARTTVETSMVSN